ncbi:hypothetical protein B0I35DRAFT_434660 [Stachybotrys elegans]|uniref:Heterokaryon incompatibility domain-containing protein n=1 Tax=Stachybotrys elegans TaxID=80388 RepID=A0A8K0SQX0_9HYPO|nr:hypothetical protein B0I35DRAFT_434660 [Stachybotrys elegans]
MQIMNFLNKLRRGQGKVARSWLPERKCPLHHSSGSHHSDSVNGSNMLQSAVGMMEANGWCFHHIRHLSMAHDDKTMLYLAETVGKPRRDVSHDVCRSARSCVAYNTDMATYKPRHATTNCNCSLVETPYDDLVSILRRGDVPLVSIDYDATYGSIPRLRVHRRTATSQYIALSHVWADGLGNSKINALPQCQIEKLKAIIDDMGGGDMSFWMDTLCIPVGSAELSLKLSEIDRMASIYQGATSCLVLDAELMETQLNCSQTGGVTPIDEFDLIDDYGGRVMSKVSASTEARAHIACSVWMLRSWTFQEAYLPPTIAISFSNNTLLFGRTSERDGEYMERAKGSVQVYSMIDGEDATASNMSHNQAETTLLGHPSRTYGSIPGQESQAVGQNQSLECQCVDIRLQRTLFSQLIRPNMEFARAWNELAGRSTTMASDVPLILTNVLDLENHNLLQYCDTHEMFLAIILSLERPPLSLFFNTGLRYDETGNHHNRWVPQEIQGNHLVGDGHLLVHKRHLSYDYQPFKTHDRVSIYIIDGVLPLRSKAYIQFEEEGMTYVVENSRLNTDDLDTKPFVATCLVVNNASLSRNEEHVACFYVRRATKSFPGRPTLHLTFHRPFYIHRVRNTSDARDQEPAYKARRVSERTELHIYYDTCPNFARLQRRIKPSSDFDGFILITVLVTVLVSPAMLCALPALPSTLPFRIFAVVILVLWSCSSLLPIPAEIVLGLQKWRYTRSFEAIANKRQMNSVV